MTEKGCALVIDVLKTKDNGRGMMLANQFTPFVQALCDGNRDRAVLSIDGVGHEVSGRKASSTLSQGMR